MNAALEGETFLPPSFPALEEGTWSCSVLFTQLRLVPTCTLIALMFDWSPSVRPAGTVSVQTIMVWVVVFTADSREE